MYGKYAVALCNSIQRIYPYYYNMVAELVSITSAFSDYKVFHVLYNITEVI
jgi:hypothetical protein